MSSDTQRLTLGTSVLHIGALWTLVVAQPLFDTFSRQPQFFLARPSEPADIIGLTLVLCLLLPGVLALVEAAAYKAGEKIHWFVHLLLLGGLLLCLGPQLARLMHLTHTLPALLVSLALTALGLWLVATSPVVSSFLSILAIVCLWFPINFLFFGSASNIVFRRINAGALAAPIASTTPIVFVTLDEFPITSLLDAQGGIDKKRFPNFARLASQSTWYRYASGVCDDTTLAIPAILTGQPPQPNLGPFLVQHPKNLFTWLGGSYELWVSEYITMMSPQGQTVNAKQKFGERFRTLLEDALVIYGHIALPDQLGDRWLPSTEHAWQGFFHRRFEMEGRSQDFRRFLAGLEPSERPRLHFIHLLLPHYPYVYLPDGHQYDNGGAEVCEGFANNVWQSEWAAHQAYQRHLLQVAFVDKLLGEMLDQMQKSGLYDQALIVVTADHGASFQNGIPHRSLTPENAIDELFVPLFIKAPRQSQGAISEANANSLDILPTIASLLGVELPWPVEGHSLLDQPFAETPKRMYAHIYSSNPHWVGITNWVQGYQERTRRARQLFPEPGLEGLYAIGPLLPLVGHANSELKLSQPLEAPVEMRLPELLENVDKSSQLLPARLSGWVHGLEPRTPLVVSLNGEVAATTFVNAENAFSAMVDPERLQAGTNQVQLYALKAGKLHPLPDYQHQSYTLADGLVKSSDGQSYSVTKLGSSLLEELTVDDSRVTLKGWAEVTQAQRLVLFWDGRYLASWPLSGSGRIEFSQELPRPSPLPDPARIRLFVIGQQAGQVSLKEHYSLAPTFGEGVSHP
ncbi:MAG: sulfatase-like hydrolase/transferase [Vulcanimicrobiota bacterium]